MANRIYDCFEKAQGLNILRRSEKDQEEVCASSWSHIFRPRDCRFLSLLITFINPECHLDANQTSGNCISIINANQNFQVATRTLGNAK